MAKRTTRVIAELNPGDEIQCHYCNEWKEAHTSFPARGITQRYSGSGRANYITRCNDCQRLYNSLRRWEHGKVTRKVTVDAVRNALGTKLPKQIQLNTPNHPKRPKQRFRPKERKLRHELYKEVQKRKLRDRKPCFVYCIGMVGNPYAVKIGLAEESPYYRLAEMQTGNPWELKVLGYISGNDEKERELHVRYIDQNILGEWFKPSSELLAEFDADGSSPLD